MTPYQKFINELSYSPQPRYGIMGEVGDFHHILPRCLGGSDESCNILFLTHQEHYKAHKLLAEEHPKNYKLQCAWWRMSTDSKGLFISDDEYAYARACWAKTTSEHLKKVNSGVNHNMFGIPRPPEVREKISKSLKARAKRLGIKKKVPMTLEEQKLHLSKLNKGKKHTKEAIVKIGKASKLKHAANRLRRYQEVSSLLKNRPTPSRELHRKLGIIWEITDHASARMCKRHGWVTY